MRILLIVIVVVIYLLSLIFIESELVKLEVRKEYLENRVTELRNQKKLLEFEVMNISNLANIEAEAKLRGFIYPKEEDILGVVK
jgi:cell division protein FtsL